MPVVLVLGSSLVYGEVIHESSSVRESALRGWWQGLSFTHLEIRAEHTGRDDEVGYDKAGHTEGKEDGLAGVCNEGDVS